MNKRKMEKVNLENCKMGARVMLAFPDPYNALSLSESNPVMGTSFECAGTVRFFKKSFFPKRSSDVFGIDIGVAWDNGKQNFYREYELVLVDESKVNISSGYVSIWDQ